LEQDRPKDSEPGQRGEHHPPVKRLPLLADAQQLIPLGVPVLLAP